jgi:putative tricarboxylic transport membrane protein
MLTTDRLAGGALIVFALAVIWESLNLPFGTLRQPGPSFIPVLLALLLIAFGVSLMLVGGAARACSSLEWSEWRHAVAILSTALFSLFGLERLGYRLTILLMLLFLLKVVERRRWMLSLGIAFSLAFGSFFLFHSMLRVPLPQGPFGF